MIDHSDITDGQLREQIWKRTITLAGNMRLRIFGKLNCQSGKRMKRNNRVFFQGQEEAIAAGFRPCGHCMKSDYQNWKDGLV